VTLKSALHRKLGDIHDVRRSAQAIIRLDFLGEKETMQNCNLGSEKKIIRNETLVAGSTNCVQE
jgi:hypothetical protein